MASEYSPGESYASSPSSSSQSSSESIDRKYSAEIEDCLDSVIRTDSFATFKSTPQDINPGLNIRGFGTLGFPLSQHEAEALLEHAHCAPLAETHIDQPTKGIAEIRAQNVKFLNDAWPSKVKSVALECAEDLAVTGPTSSIQADLDKLLICTGEADRALESIKRAKASGPGSIGTLAFSLPSVHVSPYCVTLLLPEPSYPSV